MIIATRIYTRTNDNVPWHLDHPYVSSIYTREFKDHVDLTYRFKMINHTYLLSDDKLSLTFAAHWQSLEDYQVYMNDPICIAAFENRDNHNNYYDIVSEPSIITEA